MCNFKSGVILKNRVVLAPEGNESHSNLLESLGIEDSHMNASKTFVRAELTPKDDNRASDVSTWEYRVDQDIVPDWYEVDPERYEEEFRSAVKDWMNDKFVNICDCLWTEVKDKNRTYYFYYGTIPIDRFGENNNYAESDVRKMLVKSDLARKLKEKFGDRIIPVSVDLTSMDGFKDYGKVEEDILSAYDIDIFRKFGEKIPLVDRTYWLATPNQTPSRGDSRCVQYVGSCGRVRFGGCGWGLGVRPFFSLKSSIFVSCQ